MSKIALITLCMLQMSSSQAMDFASIDKAGGELVTAQLEQKSCPPISEQATFKQFQKTITITQLTLSYKTTKIGDDEQPRDVNEAFEFLHELRSDELTRIFNSARFKTVTKLKFDGAPIGNDILKALSNSPHMESLEDLSLQSANISDVGMDYLENSPYIKNLKKLDLWKNRVGEYGLSKFVKLSGIKTLTQLDIGNNDIGVIGFCSIIQSPNMQQLTVLNLSYNDRIATTYLEQLKGFLPNLTELYLRSMDLAENAGSLLSVSACAEKLKVLDLAFNRLRLEGVKYLMASKTLSSDLRLNLYSNAIQYPHGFDAEFKARFPKGTMDFPLFYF